MHRKSMNPRGKYRPFPPVYLPDRKWPSRTLVQAPIWCSVDLRDGNQALPVPMTVSQKLEYFKTLVACGFKEIEVGFPAASPTEFEFVRRLITEKLIPDDVTIQVLVQAREDLIKRTCESLVGARRVIIHMYNSTSPAQRRIVFGLEKPEIVAMAVRGTKWVKVYATAILGDTDVVYQYSPESFSATEVEFSLEISEAVIDTWQPTTERKMILNLPCTVEVAMPNVYADQIEWMIRHIKNRESIIVSVHTHNDRGTGVAATELAMLAGAERVEGTLFGNGERTGNLDIITVALNLYTQGINPGLDFTNLSIIQESYEQCTGMKVPQRQPYSGELVFTAFSGSHQDAIRKGLRNRDGDVLWNVPYLIIDPEDIGRQYAEIIRVNGQSGKGGIGYLLEKECGIHLPPELLREFGALAGRAIDAAGREVTAADLKALLWKEYVERDLPYKLISFDSNDSGGLCHCRAKMTLDGNSITVRGKGNGPVDAFVRGLVEGKIADLKLHHFSEHALGEGSEARAISYVSVEFPKGIVSWGAGVHTSIQMASIRAIVSAMNREQLGTGIV